MRQILGSIRHGAYLIASSSVGLVCGIFQGRLSAEVDAARDEGAPMAPAFLRRHQRRYRVTRSALRTVFMLHERCDEERAEAMVQDCGFSPTGYSVDRSGYA